MLHWYSGFREQFRLVLPTLISPTKDQFVSFRLLNIYNNNWLVIPRHSMYIPSDILGFGMQLHAHASDF